jgi:hypothetical protein
MGYFERRRQRKEQERKISEAWKTSGAAEESGLPEVPRDLAKKLADVAESSRMTTAQLMVSVAANQVKDGNLRTDEELRDDLRCEGNLEEVSGLLGSHELALELLRTRYAPDPLTPKVEAQLERKIAVMRELLGQRPA